MATSFHGPEKTPKVDVNELFNLLESSEIKVAEDIKKLIQENLSTCKESWLVYNLVDHYFATESSRAMAILVEVRDPHDKHLLEKLHDGMKSSEHKLTALSLLLHVVCRDPPLVGKIISHQVFGSIMKCLKTDSDICNLMTGVMVLTILLPSRSVPALIGPHLNDIFDVFSRLAAFSIKKPGNVPDVFLLHLHVAVYALFHRLYGMFPCCFQAYLAHTYNVASKKENIKIYQEVIKPMLERVRFHPLLVTGSKEWEVSASRWKNLETQDVIIDCAKMSLDLIEGTWEEQRCPVISRHVPTRLLYRDPQTERYTPSNLTQTGECGGAQTLQSEHSPASVPGNYDPAIFWSPSATIGLCTPPLSQMTTPASSFLDISSSSPYYNCGPPFNTPVNTPRETPTLHEELDKKLLKQSSNTNILPKNRLSTGSNLSSRSNYVTPASSVPPSPMRPEFTTEPHTSAIQPLPRKQDPHAVGKSQQRIQAIRELNFADPQPFSESSQLELSVLEDPPSSPLLPPYRDNNRVSTEDANPVSLDAIPQVIKFLGNQDAGGDDMEVSELTEIGKTAPGFNQQSAESVAQFVRNVNRIRFNSLTTTNSVDLIIQQDKFVSRTRSRSCPYIWELLSDDDEDTSPLSLSLSIPSKDLQSLETSSKNGFSDSSRSSVTKGISAQSSTDNSSSSKTVDRQDSTGSQGQQIEPASALPHRQSQRPDLRIYPTASSPMVRKTSRNCSGGSSGGGRYNYIDFLHYLLQPICRKCHMDLISSPAPSPTVKFPGKEVPLFSMYTPPELLDRHIQLGEDIHSKEQSKLPLTSRETVNWAHFGDEIKILKDQLLLTHNQLMYERHKRELHAIRNRRLLGKIFNAKSLEEQNSALADTIHLQEKEIRSLEVSLKILGEKYRHLKTEKKNNEQQKFTQLRDVLKENEELKSAKFELNRMLVHQREDQDVLVKTLQGTQYKLFNCEKEVDHLEKEVVMTQKLKEQVFQLHKELLLMGELQQKYQEKLHANKDDHNDKPELQRHISSLKSEIKTLTAKLHHKNCLLEGCHAKMAEMDDLAKNKDVALADMKKKLETIKTSQDDEIKATEDKYKSMLKINRQMEGEILKLHSQLLELGWQRSGRSARAGQFVSHIESRHQHLIYEETRDRTNSDPLTTQSGKDQVKRMGSVPAYCKMDGGASPTAVARNLERSSSSASAESAYEVVDNSSSTKGCSSTDRHVSKTDWYVSSESSSRSTSSHTSFYTDSSELRISGSHTSGTTCDKNGYCS